MSDVDFATVGRALIQIQAVREHADAPSLDVSPADYPVLEELVD